MGSPSQPGGIVRYGIVGSGMMGCEHILNLAAVPGAEVVAVCEPEAEPRSWAEACLGTDHGARFFDDHRSMLADSDLDAVVVATPNHTHIDVLRDLLATDLHVMSEKPLCTTVADAVEVTRLAAARSPVTWCALEYRFMPTVSVFVDALARGLAGELRMLSIREHRFPFLVKVGNWNRFTANTGGTLVEKCCHFFDLMNLVAAPARPVRVYASGAQDVNHLDEVYPGPDGTPLAADILDNAFVIVDFDNGLRSMLDLCMFAEGARVEQELGAVGDAAKVETTVPGDRVWVRPRDRSAPCELTAPLAPEVRYEGFHHGSSYLEHLRFLDCIREGRPAEVTFDDGLWSVAVGVAAHRSIAEGRPVQLDEFAGDGFVPVSGGLR